MLIIHKSWCGACKGDIFLSLQLNPWKCVTQEFQWNHKALSVSISDRCSKLNSNDLVNSNSTHLTCACKSMKQAHGFYYSDLHFSGLDHHLWHWLKKTTTFSLHSFFILEVTDLLWLKNTKIDQLKTTTLCVIMIKWFNNQCQDINSWHHSAVYVSSLHNTPPIKCVVYRDT